MKHNYFFTYTYIRKTRIDFSCEVLMLLLLNNISYDHWQPFLTYFKKGVGSQYVRIFSYVYSLLFKDDWTNLSWSVRLNLCLNGVYFPDGIRVKICLWDAGEIEET